MYKGERMKLTIKVDDYLSEAEIKELCREYVKETLAGNSSHKERVLSNMAYSSAYAILDTELTEDDKSKIRNKMKEIISDPSSYSVFRKKDAWGEEDSAAYIEVKKSIEEHKHLISGLVKKAILKWNYSKELPEASDYVGEYILDALRRGFNTI